MADAEENGWLTTHIESGGPALLEADQVVGIGNVGSNSTRRSSDRASADWEVRSSYLPNQDLKLTGELREQLERIECLVEWQSFEEAKIDGCQVDEAKWQSLEEAEIGRRLAAGRC